VELWNSGTKPHGSNSITFQVYHTFAAFQQCRILPIEFISCKIPHFYFVYTFPIAFHKFTKRSQTNLGIEIWTRQRLSGQLVIYKKIPRGQARAKGQIDDFR
jgi:hypothetical protein